MIGIVNDKGIPRPKLEHIFWGTVKGSNVSGYHCDKKHGDERVYAEVHLYPKTKRKLTVNGKLRVFEAVVREKNSGLLKNTNGGKSSFFAEEWSRQDVVDCIDRLKRAGKIIKKYNLGRIVDEQSVYFDSQTGIVVVDNKAGAYPLLRY